MTRINREMVPKFFLGREVLSKNVPGHRRTQGSSGKMKFTAVCGHGQRNRPFRHAHDNQVQQGYIGHRGPHTVSGDDKAYTLHIVDALVASMTD